MNKYQLYTLGGALLAAASLGGCASNGKIASKANGPVDAQVTFDRTCQGFKLLDQGWDAAVVAAGGRISAEDIAVEKDAYRLISAICFNADGSVKAVPTDLPGAILTLSADAAPIGDLIRKYSVAKPPSE